MAELAPRASIRGASMGSVPARYAILRDCTMAARDDDLTVRPGRIKHGNKGAQTPKSFVGQVTRAAKKAGHTGSRFGGGGGKKKGGSTFGRGRKAGLSRSLHAPTRRVTVKVKVVRHKGA